MLSLNKSRRTSGRSLLAGMVMCSALMAVSAPALALAPEHEIRRLMLATEEAVTAERWGEASEYLNRLQKMEGEKPADYFYYRGRAMLQAGHLNEARSALEAYVTRAGAEGDHYQPALKLITDIEKEHRATVRELANNGGQVREPVAIIEPASGQDITTLRQLYLADSDREALTVHLNALLETAGWRRDKTVVRLDRPADIRYRVSVSNGNLNIQEITRNTDETTVQTSSSFAVFGINPQPRWDCEPAVGACWIYDPRDGSRLFQLAHSRNQVNDIALTLGRLIRNLQQGGAGS